MKKATLLRKLPALLLTVAAGQLTFASAASAQGGLLGTGLFAPPPAPAAPAAAAAGPAAVTPAQVEQKLEALHYDVGPIDGNIDAATRQAVMAFQKVNGLERTGDLTDEVKARIMATEGTPAPLLANGEANRVEVDLARQVLFLYENGSLLKILTVATGTAKTPTPRGTFRMYRSDPGWHTSALGRLYNAQYFVGGYAIHGSTSVPAQPASHGCIRIPMNSAEWFPERVTRGTQVFIQ
ncbi:MAG TPA: L,D-transpeptidase family protein [Acidimicrobiales bacterium]|nr:L,D-transpeptidase family protein [Acidimicrobiales bacterium]